MKTSVPPTDLWQTTYDWMRLLGYKINKQFCKEEISTHPDYPALTSVVDFLNTGGTYSFTAADATGTPAEEFNYPLLAHIKQPGNESFRIIASFAQWKASEDIMRYWTGVILYAEKNSSWHSVEHDNEQKNQLKKKALWGISALAGIIVYCVAAYLIDRPVVSIFASLSLAGTVLSVYAWSTELGYQNTFIKQVCGAVNKGGCEHVLKSKFAKPILGFTPADLSLLYFGTQFLLYIIGVFYPATLLLLMTMSLTGVLVSGWSVFVQKFILKQWCALCLGLVLLLLLQFSVAVFYFFTIAALFDDTMLTVSLLAVLVFGFLALLLIPVKSLLKKVIALKQKALELRKWKTNGFIFLNQLKNEPEVDTRSWNNELILGKAEAPINITVACNPYCAPCATAHRQLDALLAKYGTKVNVQVRLLFDVHNPKDMRTSAADKIIRACMKSTSLAETQQMLTDWFEWMNAPKWSAKWENAHPEKVIDLTDATAVLHQHSSWIQSSNVTHTPTFFINGRKLPGTYSLEDFGHVIPDYLGYVPETNN